MGLFDSAKDKATEFANNNPDKVSQGVEKGGDFVDSKTDDKYSDQIDKGQDAVDKHFGGGNDANEGDKSNDEAGQ
ncbi:antitoxin [Dermatophilaceae bacterium Sec6.4]|nr:antitoxin [Actinomycetota bacterium]